MRPMTENEKNFLQCALIMGVCGTMLLLLMKWTVVAIVIYVLAAIMVVIGVCMYIFTDGDPEEDEKDTSVSDYLRMEGLVSKKNKKD